MNRTFSITTLFVDVGGVLQTNGWNHLTRNRAARQFNMNWAEMDERHRLVFKTHEEGKLSFEEYIGWGVFYEKRTFTPNQFRDFMFAQSKPYPRMLELIAQLKRSHRSKFIEVSNESRAVNVHRIHKFRLDQLADTFIFSCFVGLRKPDVDIFRLAFTSPRLRQNRSRLSTTRRCSSKSRTDWGCEAFSISICNPPMPNWFRLA